RHGAGARGAARPPRPLCRVQPALRPRHHFRPAHRRQCRVDPVFDAAGGEVAVGFAAIRTRRIDYAAGDSRVTTNRHKAAIRFARPIIGEEAIMAFAPGDVVTLKSGGHSMTVVSVGDDDIDCLWIGDDGELFRQSIPAIALSVIELTESDDEEDEAEEEEEGEEDAEGAADEEKREE